MKIRYIFLQYQEQQRQRNQQQQQQNNNNFNPPPPQQQQQFNQQTPRAEPQAQTNPTATNQNTTEMPNYPSTSTSSPAGGNGGGGSNTSTDIGNNYSSSGSGYSGGYGSYDGSSSSSPSSSPSGSEPSTAPTTPPDSRPSSPAPKPEPKKEEKVEKVTEQAQEILADDNAQPEQIQVVIEKLENLPTPSGENEKDNNSTKEQIINDLNVKLIQKQQNTKAKKTAEKVVTKLLQNHQVKINDLKIPNLSNENWKDYINKLETSQQVANFVQQVQQQIVSLKAKYTSHRQAIVSSNKEEKQGQKVVFGVVGGVLVLGITAMVITIKNHKIKK
ncbi:hypothetical protein [endosymbiont GvMRE of Glomus versiforme]|uniref:hypothetical protein n=1 Tax=endosymbiont GvMRE of Glomus versiforme TaxID=2039283 RepID=UPI000ECDEC3C|nr:hypothetical protein [endosymbiont GvMRE of Glomus versiforme]RHZ37227.1 hypothetical protein GvMRE_I1g461 [endosymbiont GvMRE of Glomus versiforme]